MVHEFFAGRPQLLVLGPQALKFPRLLLLLILILCPPFSLPLRVRRRQQREALVLVLVGVRGDRLQPRSILQGEQALPREADAGQSVAITTMRAGRVKQSDRRWVSLEFW